jgi:uncharacterized RDD family membrane protein YckC
MAIENNPYQPPNSRVDDVGTPELQQLAGRWVRLGASLIDAIMMMALLLPLEYAGGFFDVAMEAGRTGHQLPLGVKLMWSAIGIAMFALIQGYPLVSTGQTWGKRLTSIRIATLDGAKPPIATLIVREGVYMLLGVIPIVGAIGSLVNILLIFRGDRRCGHDLVAGTRVISA